MQDISKNIIIHASKGDMNAFESIYNAVSGFVYSIAYKMTYSREDAQEITQDVFLKIYKNLKWFRFQSSFTTWVYRITVNVAINFSKRRAREQEKMITYKDDVKLKTAAIAKEEKTHKAGNEEILGSLLAILNPDQRACMILRNIEGLSYKEIAKTLKININTVRTRLKRAREKILDNFQKRGGKQ